MSFLRKLFRRQSGSSAIAKERLQLVLVHDRGFSPQLLEKMKSELIDVISKYVEIEENGIEVQVTRSGTQDRLVANIPVRRGSVR
ncbi:MAG: cell division topological specificity factor MinE [Chloroflexia bacterium]|nr:cell division topological specificity factor MinE [Chloroflexia bacterium]